MIDREKIESKIDLIDRNLKKLGEKGSEIENFWDQQGVKYTLQEIIEACIDISNHIISAEGFERPEEYREYFRVLGDENLIEKGLSEKLQQMAGFRNILVHRYQEVENERLKQFIDQDLGDIEDFINQLNTWMDEKEN